MVARGLAVLVPALALLPAAAGLPLPVNLGAAVDGDNLLNPLGVAGNFPGAGVCGGQAPQTTSCFTGTFDWQHGFFYDVSQGFLARSYTGTLVSTITYDGGFRSWTCNFNGNLVPINCFGAGSNPPPGVPFAHRCASFNSFSTVPGGQGIWTCNVLTDI